MLEKTCSRCKQLLDVSKFYKAKNLKDGYSNTCKTCESERSKKYYLENKETILKRVKEHYQENKEIISEYKTEYRLNNKNKITEYSRRYSLTHDQLRRKYRLENKKAILDYSRRYSLEHKKEVLERSRRYRSENREAILERARIHRFENKEESQALVQRRRARKANNGGCHTAAEIKYLKEIQDFRCLMCNRKEPEIQLTFDHIVPISKGGGDGIGNCQMLCKSCNSSKNAKFIDLRGIKPSKKPQHF